MLGAIICSIIIIKIISYEFEGEIRIFNGAVILSDKLILYLGFVFMCTGTTTTYAQVRKALFISIYEGSN